MKKFIVFLRPGPIAVLSLLIVSAFLRYYLYVNTNQLVSEFKNQNYKEIYSQDTLKISSRLNSLSSVINWVCIEGTVGDKKFYLMENGECETGLFKHKKEIFLPEANNLKISFTLRLPKEVEILFFLFLILQAVLILAIFISTKLNEQYKLSAEMKISKMARQMSHDVRSPLAALNTTLSSCHEISKENRLVIEKAILRINEISNSLLSNTKNSNATYDMNSLPILSNTNIFSLLNEVIDEKKSILKNNSTISIFLECQNDKLESLVETADFKRVVSNLINNSIEAALSISRLEIFVSLKEVDNKLSITIKDNGQGIPADVLTRLGTCEITSKKNGNGLGVFHAFEIIKSWNGELKIDSQLGKGTEITILLPKTSQHSTTIILLEDDELIRTVWLSSARLKNINFLAFENKSSFLESIDQISKNSPIYIDSDLGNGEKGEDVANILNQKGFKHIFMATGHNKEHFSHMKFLSGVVGKSPPWK